MKSFLITMFAAVLSVSAFGQGEVTLANNSSTLITNAFTGQPVAIGRVTYQLLVGPLGSTEGQLTPLFPTAGTGPVAGRIANTIVFIPLAPNGQMVTFQIRAWDSSYASYEEAIAQTFLTGQSVLFNSVTSFQAPGDPPPTSVSLAGKYPAFVVGVPEPSTWALFSLGGIALFLSARGKKRTMKG